MSNGAAAMAVPVQEPPAGFKEAPAKPVGFGRVTQGAVRKALDAFRNAYDGTPQAHENPEAVVSALPEEHRAVLRDWSRWAVEELVRNVPSLHLVNAMPYAAAYLLRGFLDAQTKPEENANP